MFTENASEKDYTFSSSDEEVVTLTDSITFTTENTYVLNSGDILSITSETLEFNSLVRTIGGTGPLFEVNALGSLSLTNIEVISTSIRSGGAIAVLSSSGLFAASGVTFTGCNSTVFGGAVYSRGVSNFTDTSFNGGYANTSGALFNSDSGVMTVAGGSFTDCHSDIDGGAFSNSGTMTVTGATFSQNRAKVNGGDGTSSAGTLTIQNCQLSDAYAFSTNSNGGSLYVSGGTIYLTDTVIQRSRSGTKGGGVGVTGGEVLVSNLVVEDAYTELASQGTGMFVSAASVNGSGLVFNSSAESLSEQNSTAEVDYWRTYSASGRVKTQEGGGIYVDEGADVRVANLVCDNLAAQYGSCALVFKGSLQVTGGLIQNNYGASIVDGGTGTVFIKDLASVTFTDTVFQLNTLNPSNTGQKGGAIYMLNAFLTLEGCTFTNHSVTGQGGGIMMESESTLTATDIVVRACSATTEGGFLYASTGSVEIDGIDARDCACVVDEDEQSAGGVLYAASSDFVIVKNSNFVKNRAFSGGALYVDQVRECVGTDAEPCTTALNEQYQGLQVYDSVFEANVAATNTVGSHGNGGAVAGKQSIGYFKNVKFVDNEAQGLIGSALDLASNAVFQVVTMSTTVETSDTASLLSSTRIVLDNATLSVNRGIGVLLGQDLSSTDSTSAVDGDGSGTSTYPIMNRNSDLSALVVQEAATGAEYADGAWAFMPCTAANGNPEVWYPSIDLPAYEDLGATYDPVCPATATCTDSTAQRGILCTCPSGSYYSNVINTEMSCDSASETETPTVSPTAAFVRSPTVPNTTYTMGDQDFVLGIPLFDSDLPEEVFLWTIVLTVVVGAVVLMTLAVNCSLHEGPPQEVLDDRVFWAMAKAPAYFHLLMCVERQPFMDAVKELPDEQPDEGADGSKLEGSSEGKKGKKGRRHRTQQKRNSHAAAGGGASQGLLKGADGGGSGDAGASSGTSPLLKKGALENLAYPAAVPQGGGGGRLAARVDESKEERGGVAAPSAGSKRESRSLWEDQPERTL